MFARGNQQRAVFHDDADRQVFLVVLKGVIAVYGLVIHAYCLMGNHVHLVVEAPGGNLGASMQRLLGAYARFFNMRYELSGHVFKRPYGSVPIRDERQLAAAITYVEANPVEAGLCGSSGEWPWSSAADDPAGCGSPVWKG